MSCYEWSHGTIKLPSVAFAPFKKAIQEAATKQMQREFDNSQKFWASLSTKQKNDPAAYQQAVWACTYSEDLPDGIYPLHGQKPKRVLKGDLKWPTNKTLSFHATDLNITFDPAARTVTYDVMDNNHARDYADKTAIGQEFWRQIKKVRWTAGTGGVIIGNDEYNRDDDSVGGGGNYVVAAFGYVGIKEAPDRVEPFVNAKGERIKCEVRWGKHGWTGKAVKDTSPAYGQRRYGMAGQSSW